MLLLKPCHGDSEHAAIFSRLRLFRLWAPKVGSPEGVYWPRSLAPAIICKSMPVSYPFLMIFVDGDTLETFPVGRQEQHRLHYGGRTLSQTLLHLFLKLLESEAESWQKARFWGSQSSVFSYHCQPHRRPRKF